MERLKSLDKLDEEEAREGIVVVVRNMYSEKGRQALLTGSELEEQ